MDPAIVPNAAVPGRPPSDELRLKLRRRILKGGIIAFNNRQSTVARIVRDLSDTGARLRVDGSINAPDTFDLIIELDGLEARCRVMWRKGNEIGAQFLAPPTAVAPRRSQTVQGYVPGQKPTLRRKLRPV